MKPSFIEAVVEEIIKPVLPKEWLQGHQATWSTPPAASWSAARRATAA
jgi:hypothetical protein